MKALMCIVFLGSVYLCSATEYGLYINKNYNSKGEQPTNKEVIKRPCPKHDVECIRHVLAERMHCKPVRGPAPDPYPYDNVRVYIPHSNFSFVWRNAHIRGLNDYKIKEFYVNEKTNKIVLEVEFSILTAYSPKSDWYFYVKGKEPIITRDYFLIIYRGLSLTLTLSGNEYSELSEADVYTYVQDENPPMSIGPEVMPKDPAAYKSYIETLGNLGLSVKEVSVVQGPEFMAMFMNSCICDFSQKKYPH